MLNFISCIVEHYAQRNLGRSTEHGVSCTRSIRTLDVFGFTQNIIIFVHFCKQPDLIGGHFWPPINSRCSRFWDLWPPINSRCSPFWDLWSPINSSCSSFCHLWPPINSSCSTFCHLWFVAQYGANEWEMTEWWAVGIEPGTTMAEMFPLGRSMWSVTTEPWVQTYIFNIYYF